MIKNRIRNLDLLIILVLLAGCSYYSKTDMFVVADKVDYGLTGVHLINATVDLQREMNAEGVCKR